MMYRTTSRATVSDVFGRRVSASLGPIARNPGRGRIVMALRLPSMPPRTVVVTWAGPVRRGSDGHGGSRRPGVVFGQ
jgi:hypothetical protein